MRVKMLEDAPGSPDGVTVNEYSEGVVYEVTDSLGAAFVAADLADETDEDVAAEVDPVEEAQGADTEQSKRRGRKTTSPDENK